MPKITEEYLRILTAAVREAKDNLANRERFVADCQKSLDRATEQRATAAAVVTLLEAELAKALPR
jgi:hypothetical protein